MQVEQEPGCSLKRALGQFFKLDVTFLSMLVDFGRGSRCIP
jgi:hypothetical protein